MTSDFLLPKPEVVVFGSKLLRDRLDQINTLDGVSLTSSLSVRTLAVIFDQDPSFNSHMKHMCLSL